MTALGVTAQFPAASIVMQPAETEMRAFRRSDFKQRYSPWLALT
jgi:hypothetical protein